MTEDHPQGIRETISSLDTAALLSLLGVLDRRMKDVGRELDALQSMHETAVEQQGELVDLWGALLAKLSLRGDTDKDDLIELRRQVREGIDTVAPGDPAEPTLRAMIYHQGLADRRAAAMEELEKRGVLPVWPEPSA